ncbi:glutamate--cysteine ligase [Suttonella sp. R2A3]|uniref:glutamate--cysteine ligase n=1 Tax=Suttonella sp. R2A3 TaxID=2908648 RepID=UPI001F2AC221|nr:glutamate--cysteine ligase [Suttonella sp. R2A3]UJF23731.1 glutamate--cysteine ligase [Suttonella sp. R2A3]
MTHIEHLPLHGGTIGIEREMLRVDSEAHLATTPHPPSLGHSFTHPQITIDFAEALLELVTDPHDSAEAAYQELLELHRYTRAHTGNERLWAASMPCILPDDLSTVEIGQFGQSNAGRLKRLYRIGLYHRYGMAMQMIAGVHFNYSPPQALWEALGITDRKARDARYMMMLRNLQRYGWMICYLFGASPAVHNSFQPAHGILNRFNEHTLGWANATSLRMSELGYQNKANFTVSFNDLHDYIRDLVTAVMTPAPNFEYLGLKDDAGNYQQISTHILQIANEYYTAARPKEPLKTGELPANALNERGIGYVELRLLDINPYDPCGVSLEQLRFLEIFMLYALLEDAAEFTHADWNELNSNRLRIACCGVNDIRLFDHGQERCAKAWTRELLEAMTPIARRLDQQRKDDAYEQTLTTLQRELEQGERLPQRVQHDLKDQPFINWAQALTQTHDKVLSEPCSPAAQTRLDQAAAEAREAFLAREAAASEEPSFEAFLAQYFDPLAALH